MYFHCRWTQVSLSSVSLRTQPDQSATKRWAESTTEEPGQPSSAMVNLHCSWSSCQRALGCCDSTLCSHIWRTAGWFIVDFAHHTAICICKLKIADLFTFVCFHCSLKPYDSFGFCCCCEFHPVINNFRWRTLPHTELKAQMQKLLFVLFLTGSWTLCHWSASVNFLNRCCQLVSELSSVSGFGLQWYFSWLFSSLQIIWTLLSLSSLNVFSGLSCQESHCTRFFFSSTSGWENQQHFGMRMTFPKPDDSS